MTQGVLQAPAAAAVPPAPYVDPRLVGRIALLAAAALGYAVILTPNLFVCWLSFFSNEIVTFPPQGYTLRWFAHIFDQNNFVSGFVTSLQIGVAAMITPASIAVTIGVVLPVVILFRYSLNQFTPAKVMVDAVTVENYVKFFTDPFYVAVLLRTIRVAALCTAICVVLAFPMAYCPARTRSRFKNLLLMAVILPLFVGNAVRAAGWMVLIGNRGSNLEPADRLTVGVQPSRYYGHNQRHEPEPAPDTRCGHCCRRGRHRCPCRRRSPPRGSPDWRAVLP